ncbi:hypothetical protein M9Y10_045680 [Tritrichomonas musculus]|uniref:Uncharacterized protein n=1 Tax=Tritrichomonas musculus TaxID=1915356 RepID=A0ABR2JWC2_9EUKA
MTFQEQIKDRLETGFKNWNGGYDVWLKWCDTLYEPDAHYNIQLKWPQKRLTLQEYKDMMKVFMSHFNVELGEFHNLIIKDDWCAIRYVVYVTNRQTNEKFTQNTMEFVHFKENPQPIGARVIEGWALSDLTLG